MHLLVSVLHMPYPPVLEQQLLTPPEQLKAEPQLQARRESSERASRPVPASKRASMVPGGLVTAALLARVARARVKNVLACILDGFLCV